MAICLKFQESATVTVNLLTWLSDQNINASTDITEATFMIKREATDADADAVLTKDLTNGITVIPDIVNVPATLDQLAVAIADTDFGAGMLESGSVYYFGVGIKIAGDTYFREPDIQDGNAIRIVEDFIRA